MTMLQGNLEQALLQHMMSKVIYVSGLLDLEEDYYEKFIELPLDREARDVEQLIEKVKILLKKKRPVKESQYT